MPDQPGVYLALRIEPNEVQIGGSDEPFSDTQSSCSLQNLTNMAASYKSLALKKQIFMADYYLDMSKLPKKTQTIL